MTTPLPTASPDFYLSSLEDASLDPPRKCWRIRRMKVDMRDDALLIRLDPPLLKSVYGRYGLNADADVIMVAPRLSGMYLFPINEWPIFVYVCPITVADPQSLDVVHAGEFINLAWGELYPDYQSALDKKLVYP